MLLRLFGGTCSKTVAFPVCSTVANCLAYLSLSSAVFWVMLRHRYWWNWGQEKEGEEENRDAALEFRDGPNNLLLPISDDEIVVGRVGVEPTTPAMSRRYPNQARPPAQYTMKKFAAQIYVVDRLYMETN
jgi:hypothetical protein